MYRSSHFESQNVGQGFADGKSSNQKPNQRMPFTSNIQSVSSSANSTDFNSSGHSSGHSSGRREVPSRYDHIPTTSEHQSNGHQGNQVASKAHASSQRPLPHLQNQNTAYNQNPVHIQNHSQVQSHTQAFTQQNVQTESQSLTARVEQQMNNTGHIASQAAHNPAQFQQAPAPLSALPVATDEPLSKEQLTQEFDQSGIDLQISALFTAMGRASQLSRSQLAARLQTSPHIISALETGLLSELPEWEDLEPVICRYADFMNIDDRPILRRLREQLTEHFLTNMTVQNTARSISTPQQTMKPMQFTTETAGNLMPTPPQSCSSILPSTDIGLKALASGQPISKKPDNNDFNRSFSQGNHSSNSSLAQQQPSIEDRFTALTSAVTQSQESLHIIAQNQPFDARAAITGIPKQPQQQDASGHHSHFGITPATNSHIMPEDMMRSSNSMAMKKPKSKWMRIFGNLAFILILLVGFINWQPNRFWSGVDQLPQPISKSIYSLFEFVMPDPLASVYRMNWVHVADPRMRKADKLAVPIVKKLPRLDFSKLGSLAN